MKKNTVLKVCMVTFIPFIPFLNLSYCFHFLIFGIPSFSRILGEVGRFSHIVDPSIAFSLMCGLPFYGG